MRRGASFYVLAALFAAFVLFLYGPVVTIMILSFQGPRGGRRTIDSRLGTKP